MGKIQCPICYEKISQKKKFTIQDCNHEFCKSCLKSYLNNQITNGDVQRINCPLYGCKFNLIESEIQMCVDLNMYLKYKKFLKQQILEQDTDFIWCPAAGCENYVRINKGQIKQKCLCGTEICFKCGNTYHYNKSCDNSLDLLFKEAKQKHQISECPKCKSPIQKSSGCNHMTCRICKYQFCWICSGPYSSGHYRQMNYFNGCPGNQSTESKPWRYPHFWRFFNRLFFICLVIIAPIIILLGMILSGFITPIICYMYIVPKTQFDLYKKQNKILIFTALILAGILLYPLNIILNLIFAIGFMIYKLINHNSKGTKICFIIFFPIIAVFSGFLGPALLYMKKIDPVQFHSYSKKYKIFVYFMWVVLGILFYPISMIAYAFILLYQGINILIKKIKTI